MVLSNILSWTIFWKDQQYTNGLKFGMMGPDILRVRQKIYQVLVMAN